MVVLGFTLVVAASSARRGWDLDNVAAPLVTAAGDMVTLPSLFLAALIVRLPHVTAAVAVVAVAVGLVATAMSLRARQLVLRRIVRESLPVLLVAGVIDTVAGLAVDRQFTGGPFALFPALLVLVPPFFEDTGALGSILSARLATKLHLGTIDPVSRPQRAARNDFWTVSMLALPVYVLLALSSQVVAVVFSLNTPGLLNMVAIALIGGLGATTVAIAISYFGTVSTYRMGLDPDNFGVPLLTASMDLVGALALIGAIALLRLG